jgi:hypothetical protein
MCIDFVIRLSNWKGIALYILYFAALNGFYVGVPIAFRLVNRRSRSVSGCPLTVLEQLVLKVPFVFSLHTKGIIKYNVQLVRGIVLFAWKKVGQMRWWCLSISKRVSNNHFFMVAFLVWTLSSLRNCTLVKYSFLKRRNWNKWTKLARAKEKKKVKNFTMFEVHSFFIFTHCYYFLMKLVLLILVKNTNLYTVVTSDCSVLNVLLFFEQI